MAGDQTEVQGYSIAWPQPAAELVRFPDRERSNDFDGDKAGSSVW